VLLDANALFLPVRTGFPLDAEVERECSGAILAVPASVIGELDRLVERGAVGATGARALADRYPIVRAAGRGDDAVLATAQRRHAWVVTADRLLQHRLVRSGITVLVPRDRHRLQKLLPRGAPSARESSRSEGSGARRSLARGNG